MKNKSGKFLLSDKNAKTVMVICLVLLTAAFVFHAVQSHNQMSDIEWRLGSDIDDIKGEFKYSAYISGLDFGEYRILYIIERQLRDNERQLRDIKDEISDLDSSVRSLSRSLNLYR
jgi:hypothetical protein